MTHWFFRTALVLAPGFLSGMSSAVPAEDKMDVNASDSITAVHYICERNVEIPAVYISTAGGSSYAVIQVEGRQVSMGWQVSASGARYVALDEQNSYRWYTKGDEAWLSFLEADHAADEKNILSGCRVVDE